MKLISQMGPYKAGQPKRTFWHRLRQQGRRIKWDWVGFCILAAGTMGIALYAVRVMARMVQSGMGN